MTMPTDVPQAGPTLSARSRTPDARADAPEFHSSTKPSVPKSGDPEGDPTGFEPGMTVWLKR